MSDLQDIIASSTIRAFNAGYEAGKRHVLEAVETVTFEHHDLEVAAISDLREELEIKTNLQLSERQVTLSSADLEPKS